jgi:hypothetical protein
MRKLRQLLKSSFACLILGRKLILKAAWDESLSCGLASLALLIPSTLFTASLLHFLSATSFPFQKNSIGFRNVFTGS